ncbi:MAG: ABC transporter ATP-binding protein [Thermodesulfobacteriota bacterium]|nr:ABC transporter ATP-binding protein [Thermodesulfobacteriota bacterium]
MSCEPVISLKKLNKCYQIYSNPRDRLLQMLIGGRKQYFREFQALSDVSLDVMSGDVVGIVGCNGAGKSTLLQLICGTLAPTSGEITVNGRVAALLELGAGFNPEFTGRENIFLSAAVIGMNHDEISQRFDDIVEFSGIGTFIDQPVKTYSSGMYVRLAFSIAISVDPDILVIDEALSVGDGEFSRKSFDRIMEMKSKGKTILFCSHALYQVEAICNKALWLNDGEMMVVGEPSKVVMAYNDYTSVPKIAEDILDNKLDNKHDLENRAERVNNKFRIESVDVKIDNAAAQSMIVKSGKNSVTVVVKFYSDPTRPVPNVGICVVRQDGQTVTSVATHIDHYVPECNAGQGEVSVVFPDFALLKGMYHFDVYLMCENGIHVYDSANAVAKLEVKQCTLELGVVTLPHTWAG